MEDHNIIIIIIIILIIIIIIIIIIITVTVKVLFQMHFMVHIIKTVNTMLNVIQLSHPASTKCRQSIYVTIRNITNDIVGRPANSGH